MDKFTKIFLYIFLTLFMYCSCEEIFNGKADPEPPQCVFKFKEGKNYSKLVYVLLNDEKTRIIGYPSYGDLQYDSLKLIDYYKGYYFGGAFTYGLNSAYLDMTVVEFEEADDTLTVEDMWELIIDKDPYAEFYLDEDDYLFKRCPECVGKDTIYSVIDTAKFHHLIDNNELEKYLKRLK